ncbi:HAD family hydrolase, partial [Patescibacteria group bacterium]
MWIFYPRVLIFDMDGVIVNSEPIHVKAEMRTCQIMGLRVPEWEWENFKGKTTKDIASHILSKYGVVSEEVIDEFSRIKTEVYLSLSEEIELIEGSLECIFKFCSKKIMVLNTSSSGIIQRLVFDKFSLHDRFDFIVNGDEIPDGLGKPHEFSYDLAVRKVRDEYNDITSKDCLVIEDSDNGIIAA